MPIINDGKNDAVLVEGAIIVWGQSLTQPDEMEGGGNKWSVKVVIEPNNPAIADLQQFEQQALQNSEFKGVLPNGGRMALGQAGPQEFNGMFPGYGVINPSTYQVPQIYGEDGQNITNPMQLAQLVYTGQRVDVIVTCKAYNQKSKGIKTQLEGVRILASQQAQPIQLGGGGFNAANAFGNGGGQQQQGGFQQQQPQQQQQQGGFQPQQQQPMQQQNPQDFIPNQQN